MFDSAYEGKKIIEEALSGENHLSRDELHQLLSVINQRISNIVHLKTKLRKLLDERRSNMAKTAFHKHVESMLRGRVAEIAETEFNNQESERLRLLAQEVD